MNQTRRNFLRQSAVLAMTGMGLNAFASRPRIKMGMQLYCVRDAMKADPMGTLKGVSSIGYKVVEHANYVDRRFYGWTAKEFKMVLDDLGLEMVSGHTALGPKHWDAATKTFTDAWKYTVEDAATLGQTFVISPSMESSVRKSETELKQLLEMFNKSGELCRKYNMTFGYHNHEFEFSEKLNGRTLYDIIMKETDPKLVMQQLDTGNLFNGGVNALDTARKYPGRFQSLHVKDEIEMPGKKGTYESTLLGKGIAEVRKVTDLCREQGAIHFLIEQEAYQGMDPLECMRINYKVMRDWGY